MKQKQRRFKPMFLLLLVLMAVEAGAQQDQSKLCIGEKVLLQSQVLNEERTLLVYLPNEYSRAADTYPVLYLLDGNVHFLHVAGLSQFLAWSQRIPPLIVIGIANSNRMRDFSLKPLPDHPGSGGAGKFLQFLETELIPFVAKTYRTAPFRMLAGHSLCGSFTIYSLLSRPMLFQAAIASSPGEPGNKAENKVLWDFAQKLPSENAAVNRTLFITFGDREDADQIYYVAHIAETLKLFPQKGLDWSCESLPGETHGPGVHRTIEKGLVAIFRNWEIPDEVVFQGLAAVKKHYARFDYLLPPEIIINEAGYYFLSLNQVSTAISFFSWNVELRPRSANAYDSLADAYEKNGQADLELQNREKAYRIAAANKDPKVDSFKVKYEQLLKRKSEKE